MLQRGRKSVEGLYVDDGTVPIKTPSGLIASEKKLFNTMIASVGFNHFTPSDVPLIVSYVQATLMAQRAAKSPLQIGLFERAVKAQILLARSLRLTPRARIDARAAARKTPEPPDLPWD